MSYFFVHINDITAIKLVQFSFSKTHRYINFTSCLPSIYDDTTLKFGMFIEFDCLSDVPTLYISEKSFHLHFSLYWLTILFVLVFYSPAFNNLFVKNLLPENLYVNLKQMVYLSLGSTTVENVEKRCVPNPKSLCKAFLSL